MKIKELRKQLEEYKDEDSILVLYWDKDFADNYAESVSGGLSDQQWEKVVSNVEDRPMWQIEDIGDIIVEAIDQTKEGEGQ